MDDSKKLDLILEKLSSMDDRLGSVENKVSAVENKFSAVENKISTVEKKVIESEQNIIQQVDKKIAESENLILKELDRLEIHLEKEVDQVQRNLDEIKQFYRINKLESDNTTLLLQMYNNLEEKIKELESKIA